MSKDEAKSNKDKRERAKEASSGSEDGALLDSIVEGEIVDEEPTF
jgi:hypothetical protein